MTQAAPTTDARTIRKKLRDLGKRRKAQVKADEKLTKEIRQALEEADGQLTVSEQAKLLSLHRTTLYRVYK
jgi:ActR/RegA family two-component response regulator